MSQNGSDTGRMKLVNLAVRWGPLVLGLLLISSYFAFQSGRETNRAVKNSDDFVFLFVGHTRPNEIGKLHPSFLEILRRTKENNVSLLVLAGDTILGMRNTQGLQQKEWDIFHETVRSEIGDVPIFIAPGNHDYCSEIQKKVFIKNWGMDGSSYFVADRGVQGKKIRFVILDTVDSGTNNSFKDCWTGADITGKQLDFLKNSFADKSFDYYFVFLGHFKFIGDRNEYWFKNVHPIFFGKQNFCFCGGPSA